jgi:hypothetical protein
MKQSVGINQVLAIVKQSPIVIVHGKPGASEWKSDKVKYMRPEMPAAYRKLVEMYGCITIGPWALKGLGPIATNDWVQRIYAFERGETTVRPYNQIPDNGNPADTSKARDISTFRFLFDWKPTLLSWLLPICDDGRGNLVCLDTKRKSNGDCPVVLWRGTMDPSGIMQVPEVLAPTFAQWLWDRMKEVALSQPSAHEMLTAMAVQMGTHHNAHQVAKKPLGAKSNLRKCKTMNDICECIQKHHNVAKAHAGATLSEIQGAEQRMNVVLPESYRTFVRSVGWLNIDEEYILGLGSDAKHQDANVALVHDELVRNGVPRMPAHLVPVWEDGGGNCVCIDTTRASKGDAPVVYWDHEHPQQQQQRTRLVALTFTRWLRSKLIDRCD